MQIFQLNRDTAQSMIKDFYILLWARWINWIIIF